MQLIPYLNFKGTCEEAFKFYEKTLGGRIEAMFPHEGTPAADFVPADWRNKIMHAHLVVGDAVLMGSDSPPDQFEAMRGMSVAIQLNDPAEADRIYHALAEGGTVIMPIDETFWAVRFGMVVDRYGTPWMINCEKSG